MWTQSNPSYEVDLLIVGKFLGSGVYSKIEDFVFLPITCFSMSLTTFIGQNLGAKQLERAKGVQTIYWAYPLTWSISSVISY